MYGPEGISLFCFSKSSDDSRDEVERTRGKTKVISDPRGKTLSVLLYNFGFPLNNHIAKK